MFAEGWSDPAGPSPAGAIWPAKRLARAVRRSQLPDVPEGLGLLALMLHAESRRAARRDGAGAYVPLADQDSARGDTAAINEAKTLLLGASRKGAIGRSQLEAAVQSAHAARRQGGVTDWRSIAQLYEALFTVTGSPVVAINRAVALSHVDGPAAGIAVLATLNDDPQLSEYQPYWAARAELLAQSGDRAGADAAYERAIGLEADPAVAGSCRSACARGLICRAELALQFDMCQASSAVGRNEESVRSGHTIV